MNERPIGQWPVNEPVDLDVLRDAEGPEVASYMKRQSELARFHITLGSIRADLEEQPSPACVRIAARRWTDAIIQLADETARQLRNTG
ncbi:hypothetical protein CG740_37090 [Streptomyces sp. CB01201]|uniref:hypothetical protein n=1 Tax=Streptomyces sp. CB01201 TaxID=2020324 RepID=UPI000C26F35F|nr:hypothetical protein [Streptomyces sp. CB01201]PJM98103.1 hypothetical protein CG740_37090 [Streptomyces sp. CB01201]